MYQRNAVSGCSARASRTPKNSPEDKIKLRLYTYLRFWLCLPAEIELGLKDLEDIFHGDDYEVLMVQTYLDGWPVNRAGSGSDLGNTTPIKGLYIVGDGAKGKGGIEVEGVALGVENTITLLQNFNTNYTR